VAASAPGRDANHNPLLSLHEPDGQPQRRGRARLLPTLEQRLDFKATQVALTRDKGRMGLARQRFGGIRDLHPFASGIPINLQHQCSAVNRRARAALRLDSVEQLT